MFMLCDFFIELNAGVRDVASAEYESELDGEWTVIMGRPGIWTRRR